MKLLKLFKKKEASPDNRGDEDRHFETNELLNVDAPVAGRNDAAKHEDGPLKSPTDLSAGSWKATFKRTVAEFKDDNITDWAAALTYYGVLSLFPGLLVLVALLGLLGQHPQTTNAMVDIVGSIAPNSKEVVAGQLEGILANKGGASALLGFGLLGALWSASGYIGAFMRASNAIYEVDEGRPFWKLRPLQIAITVVGVLALTIVAIGVVATGPLAKAIGDAIGLGDFSVTVWSIAKWPVLLAIVMGMFAALYYFSPNVKPPKFRWVSPGGVIAVVVWVLASLAFGFYVSNFGSYNETYGSLGAVISFLVWMWISNIAILFGAEFDAEMERTRELAEGKPAEHQIQLPPRDEPKNKGPATDDDVKESGSASGGAKGSSDEKSGDRFKRPARDADARTKSRQR